MTLAVEDAEDSIRMDLTFREPTPPLPSGITVSTSIELLGRESRWQLRVDNDGLTALRHERFPEVWVERIGSSPEDDTLLIPRGPGAAKASPQRDPSGAHYEETYPSGDAAMQLLAMYDTSGGVYVANHDPLASMKTISAEPGQLETAAREGVRLGYRWPAEDMDQPGNDFVLPSWPDVPEIGKEPSPAHAVLAGFDGDWYDVGKLYSNWVAQHAPWWPEVDEDGRIDTPQRIKDIALWLLVFRFQPNERYEGGSPPGPDDQADTYILEPTAEQVVEFAGSFGVPLEAVGAHIYHWMACHWNVTFPFLFPQNDEVASSLKRRCPSKCGWHKMWT